MKTNDIKNEVCKIEKWKDKTKRKDLRYETKKYIYNFQQCDIIRSFSDNIYTGKISIDEAEMDQTNLLWNIVENNNRSKPRTKEGKDKKQNTFDSVNALYGVRELTLITFRSGIFLIKKQGKGLKY